LSAQPGGATLAAQWKVEVDTTELTDAGRVVDPAAPVTLAGRSLVLLGATRR
jgi:hypothetical protein